MAWQPDEAALRQLAGCMRDSLNGKDIVAQKQGELMLQQAKSDPAINNYLALLFSSPTIPPTLELTADEFMLVRIVAAVIMKNNIRTGFKNISSQSFDLIKQAVPLGLYDQNPQIRNHAGNVISEIIAKGGILAWPDVLGLLLNLVSNADGNASQQAQEAAMTTLSKICEDSKKSLDRDYDGQRPLNILVPKLIEFTQHQNSAVRISALAAINEFIPQKPQAILVALDTILQQLFKLAGDTDTGVRRQVCRAFTLIVDVRPDKIMPHLEGLVDYILAQQTMTDDEELAVEAAEFWLCVGEHADLWKALSPYLDKIIPVLLQSMVYSEDDIAELGGGDDDADEEDKAQDIKPQFATNKDARGGDANSGGAGTNGNESYKKIHGSDSDDYDEGEIEDSDEDDDDLDPEESWNLRKCSAAALDVFSTDFGAPVFEAILPYLMTNLQHADWPQREAAVLALGAVAQGCYGAVEPHLTSLVPYLIQLLNDNEPLVRQISCWTLGRYCTWAINLPEGEERQKYFLPMMEGLLKKMLDRSKKVQEAAASAFAAVEEKAGGLLVNYSHVIVPQFVACFERYKDRNMFILYDCVQTLAEHVGQHLTQPHLANMLMPALVKRWNVVSDQSRELFPLLECLSYVATAFGEAFTPYAPDIFARCIKIIHENLEDIAIASTHAGFDDPDKDFLVTSLDLISAIVQVIEPAEAARLVSSSQPNFFELLIACMDDPSSDVRQSAYANLGDCAKCTASQLGPYLATAMTVVLKQLNLHEVIEDQAAHGFSVLNNACWSLGEVAISHGSLLKPYLNDILQRLVVILSSRAVPSSVNENAGIALGRLGLQNHVEMAQHLDGFADLFLTCMDNVDFTDEKLSAFTGFTMTVAHNPAAMEKVLPHFIKSIARYENDLEYRTEGQHELHPYFKMVLDLYKQMLNEQAFKDFLDQNLDPSERQTIKTAYHM